MQISLINSTYVGNNDSLNYLNCEISILTYHTLIMDSKWFVHSLLFVRSTMLSITLFWVRFVVIVGIICHISEGLATLWSWSSLPTVIYPTQDSVSNGKNVNVFEVFNYPVTLTCPASDLKPIQELILN